MVVGDRKSLRPNQRHSLATTSSVQRQRLAKETKPKRSSLAPTSTTSPSFAQKTKSSNSRLSDVKLEESNISVYVRCRSRNEREIKESSGVVVSTMGHLGKEVVLQTGPMSVSNKTYTFDRVFGAESDQEMLYDGIAKSVLQEMLQGYNCTVFAYGQTGTGKTYTMSGDIKQTGNRLSEEAGIIPRTLVDLFKNLEENPEYSVKISFIELYNEELRDLITNYNDEEVRKVRIFEDPVKKSIVVQGMEEVYIKTADEGMKVLADGSYKRQVAATQCNDLSSRSHSVFTITVHMKEIDPISGEEYLKIGKLNLVDLAGSENINRSGAENKRAREAGMINQSLLTLGRVINALVDQSPHIPYRESKLTRLLQDSLGGRTKTCIIATISPAKVSLEETISTLEYANRAKNIKNKPQVNQTMSKKMLIKEYVQEIERLRTDLNATRNKNGVYLTEENLEKITNESESRRIQVEEKQLRINVLEEQSKKFKNDFEDYLRQIKNMEQDLLSLKEDNSKLANDLDISEKKLKETQSEVKIEKYVNTDHQDVQQKLKFAHSSLVSLLKQAEATQDELHTHIQHKQSLEINNSDQVKAFKEMLSTQTKKIENGVIDFHSESSTLTDVLNDNFNQMIKVQSSKIKNSCEFISQASKSIDSVIDKSITKIFEMNQFTNGELGKIDVLKDQIKNEIINELNELKKENIKASEAISKGLIEVGNSTESGFEQIKSFINSTFATVQSQISSQSSEIISLKNTYLEHQIKYQNILNQNVSKMINFKEEEKEKSRLEKETLLNKIQGLLEHHEQTKLQRFDNNIDYIAPLFESVGVKESEFAKNFDSFITNEWSKTQKTFQDQLNDQLDLSSTQIDSITKSIMKDQISNVSNSLQSFVSNQNENFNQSINNLDSNMESLSNYSKELKNLNKENLQFTQSQLNFINKRSNESYKEISSNFNQFGEELSESKPDLIDSFISKQSDFLLKFKGSSISGLGSLKNSISSLNYMKDELPQPKRQKLEIPINLPTNQTRNQIISKYYNEIYPESSSSSPSSENTKEPPNSSNHSEESESTLIPIPDKQFKQPLSQSTKDLNIIKQIDPSNEKRKSNIINKRVSRPNSSASLSRTNSQRSN